MEQQVLQGCKFISINRNKFARWEKKRVCPMLSSIFCGLKTHTQEKNHTRSASFMDS